VIRTERHVQIYVIKSCKLHYALIQPVKFVPARGVDYLTKMAKQKFKDKKNYSLLVLKMQLLYSRNRIFTECKQHSRIPRSIIL
jgi:hypothetical protein